MSNSSHHDRVRNLYQMLFEMATGNFAFRIQLNGHDDELDALSKELNSIACKMQDSIQKAGHIIPYFTYQSLIQTTFILEPNSQINSLSANASAILGYKPEMLFNTAFDEILLDQTKEYWRHVIKETTHEEHYHNTIQLIFLTANKQVIPSFCTVSKLLYSDKILVSSVTTVLQDTLADGFIKSENKAVHRSDSQIAQELHDYILDHLDEPLPTLKELSKIFNTNEFKIKGGFRRFFNKSVYQFFNEERLKKGHQLIQKTDIPIKSIAFMCGYNDYINFYKAFKKRFGYPPSDLFREAKNH